MVMMSILVLMMTMTTMMMMMMRVLLFVAIPSVTMMICSVSAMETVC